MKSTGIVRKIDELGRIVLPIELRRNLNLNVKDSLEIFVNEDGVILQKYQPSCIHTGTMDNLIEYKGKKVSVDAIKEMANLIGIYEKDTSIKNNF